MLQRSEAMWWGTAMEAPDPPALAAFYAELLAWQVVHEEAGTAVLAPPQRAVYVVFQQANDYQRPTWPPTWPAATDDAL